MLKRDGVKEQFGRGKGGVPAEVGLCVCLGDERHET